MKRLLKKPFKRVFNALGKHMVTMEEFDALRAWRMCVDNAVDIVPLVVSSLAGAGRPINFMQIGANDGVRDDSFRQLILKHNLRGILVEPQPRAFRELRRNYEQQSDLIFENVAISPEGGELKMYAFDREEENGLRLDVFTSTERALLERYQASFKIEARIEQINVPTATVAELLDRHAMASVSIFIIDTEGFDFEVIKLIDLPRLRPALIQFEHRNFAPAVREQCYRHLIDAGYKLCAAVHDTYAVLPA